MTLLCSHIFPDTHVCGSPALRGERFCYFHHPDRRPPTAATVQHRRARRGFRLQAPTNAAEHRAALNLIITRLASNQLDTHRAGLLLYSLQIAASSCQ